MAADAPPAVASWHAQTLLAAIGNVLIFAGIGIAAAIVAAAAILGVCIIIAASMLG